MKTRIITLATLVFLTIGTVSADNYRTLKIFDRFGQTMNIFIKIENIQETFEFNTREVFREAKRCDTTQLFDITQFIKPELEVEEYLPVYTK